MQIRFGREFVKHYNKVDKKIKTAFDKRLNLFLQNPFHLKLNNHSLRGKYFGKRSINVTGDWRAIFKEEIVGQNKMITFLLLGTHSQLYK